MKVHLLATCRNPDLFRATTFVFDTLRVGFPTAEICVWNNDLLPRLRPCLSDEAKRVGATIFNLATSTIHHHWIESLVTTEDEPFFICDTDVIFWKSVENWEFSNAIAGRLIPQFFDEFTNCITRPRLHTSLLYIDPIVVRSRMAQYYGQFPDTPFNPRPNLFYPAFHPLTDEKGFHNYFYDTCSLLFHAIGGTPLTPEQLDCYDHLHCGTISDLVGPRLSIGRNIAEKHRLIFDNPRIAKGIWKDQDEYYQHFAVLADGQ